jgi:hypothetical protein
LADPDLWDKWITKLKAKGFFEGVSEGSAAYQERYSKAVTKFAERMEVSDCEAQFCMLNFLSPGPCELKQAKGPAAPAPASSAATDAEATAAKTKGAPFCLLVSRS